MGFSPSGITRIVALCLVLGLVVLFVILDKTHGLQRDAFLGERVLDPEVAASVMGLRMTNGSESVSLLRLERDEWLVEGDGFPADSRKVFALLQTLTTAKYVRVAGTMEDNSRYGLAKDDRLLVELQGADSVFQLSLGSFRSNGGQYCRVMDHERIYLIDKVIERSAAQSTWKLRHLIDIPAAKVLKVAFETPEGQNFTFQRGKLARFEPIDGTAEELDENTAMVQLPGLLRELTFTQPIAKDGLPFQELVAEVYQVRVTLTSGTTLLLRIGKQGDKDGRWLLAAEAESVNLEERDELRSFMKLTEQWHFEVSEVIAKRFVKSHKDFLNTVQRKTESTR